MNSESSTHLVEDLIRGGILEIGDGYRAKNSELSSTGIPFARAGNINDGFQFQDADCFPESELWRAGNKVSRPGDVVFTSKGTVGRFALVERHSRRFVYSPQLCYWRSLDSTRIRPEYLYYWMSSQEFLQQISYLKGQTDMADYVSLRDQRRMTISIPPASRQAGIVECLKSIDDRINLLRETNATLEAIAKAMFKSWFVDFDPVRAKMEGHVPVGMNEATAALFPDDLESTEAGVVPAGWSLVPFGQLLSHTIGGDWGSEEPDEKNDIRVAIIRGTDIPDLRSAAASRVPVRYTSAKKLATRKLEDGDLVLEVSGGSKDQPTGRALYITDNLLMQFDCPVEPASFCRLLRPKTTDLGVLLAQHLAYIYAKGKTWEYQNQSTGISNFQTAHFMESEHVVLPDDRVLLAFARFVRPLVDRIYVTQIRELAALRDTLLPRLISGQLRLPEFQRRAAESIAA